MNELCGVSASGKESCKDRKATGGRGVSVAREGAIGRSDKIFIVEYPRMGIGAEWGILPQFI